MVPKLLVVIPLVLALLAPIPIVVVGEPARADVAPSIPDSPIGQVKDIEIAPDGTTYAVGSFTQVGASTGGFAALAFSDGLVARGRPSIDGRVRATATDDTGNVYLGGDFGSVGASVRWSIARLLPNGTLDETWSPSFTYSDPSTPGPVSLGSVYAIEVAGPRIYVGGQFEYVDGVACKNLAVIDANTGDVDPTWCPEPDYQVNALASDDSAIYVGGNFGALYCSTGTCVPRSRLAAFSRLTGALSDWDPRPNGSVFALETAASTVYVGGDFWQVNDATLRNSLAAFPSISQDDSTATAWDPNPGFDPVTVNALAIDDTLAYLGGTFSTIGGVPRYGAAAVRIDDGGTLDPLWAPDLDWGAAYTITVSPHGIVLGGTFSSVNGAPRANAALVSPSTGESLAWDPQVSNIVYTSSLSSTGTLAYLGGDFTHANLVTRPYAAAFDSESRVTDWAPTFDSAVNAIALDETTVYAVGPFLTVNGDARTRAAAIRRDDTGSTLLWDPAFDNEPYDISVDDTVAYVVGSFTRVNVTWPVFPPFRNYAAAVRIDDTGTATDWNPTLDGIGKTIALNDGVAYVGGNFTSVGAFPTVLRRYAAAIETEGSGMATSWDPDLSHEVNDLEISGGIVYLAGRFQSVKAYSIARNFFAAVNLDDTGSITAWDPSATCEFSVSNQCPPGFGPTPEGKAIRIEGSMAYLGGLFTTINGDDTSIGLAAVRTDDTGTAVTSWTPSLSTGSVTLPEVRAIGSAGGKVVIGGDYSSALLDGNAYGANLSIFPGPPTIPGPPTSVAAEAGNARATVSWSITSTGGSPITEVQFALDDTLIIDDSVPYTSNSYTMTGLTNGQSYKVYVRLVNAMGAGPWSAASGPFTPQAPAPPGPAERNPGAPTQVSAVPGNASLAVSWMAPTDGGSSPISGYTVTGTPGNAGCSTSTLACTITGLTNGVRYTLTVKARNAAGWGPESSAIQAVPRTVPGAPTGLSATEVTSGVSIRWQAPAFDGGSPVTGYRVITSPATQGCSATAATTCTLTGLKVGVDYDVSVVASNEAGVSSPSQAITVELRQPASIQITGTRSGRDPRVIRVNGTIEGMDVTAVRPFFRTPGESDFTRARARVAVVDSSFTWSRKARTRIVVYIAAGDLTSNRIVISAPRPPGPWPRSTPWPARTALPGVD